MILKQASTTVQFRFLHAQGDLYFKHYNARSSKFASRFGYSNTKFSNWSLTHATKENKNTKKFTI